MSGQHAPCWAMGLAMVMAGCNSPTPQPGTVYGTLRHNSRAIYQRYMGWYDGNPANLDNLPPEPAARRYVEYMGGEAAVLQRARADFDKGDYRWVAQVLKRVVFANPGNDLKEA